MFLSLMSVLAVAQNRTLKDSLIFLYMRGEYSEVRRIAGNLHQKGKETTDTWYLFGKVYQADYNFDSALVCYANALKYDSSDLSILSNMASVYIEKRNLRKAADIYRYIMLINPLNTEAKASLANAYLRMDEDRQAGLLFKQLIATDTANSYYLSQLGTCYYQLNNRDSAVFCFEKALHLNPDDYLTVIRLTNLYIRIGDFQKGLSLTGNYLDNDSSALQVIKLNAYIHFLLGHYEDAVKQYLKSCSYGDSSFMVMKYLGLSYFQKEDMFMAATYLDKAYRMDTADMETCLYLGISTGWTMDKGKGIDYLQKVLGIIFPADELVVRIYREIADLYVAWSRPADAIPYYMKILDYNTDNRLVLYKLGSSYEYIDKEQALNWYIEFMKTRSPDAKSVSVNSEGFMVVSYYDIAEKRIRELREELFFDGKLKEE